MKYVFYFLLIGLLGYSIQSCKEDEGNPPEIRFKTGTGYTSSDATVTVGDTLIIGIHAEKTEEEDVLKHFNISESIDNGTPMTGYEEDLSGTDGDVYEEDFIFAVPADPGHTHKLIFTVTNRDGLTNQVSLTLTIN